MSKRNDDLRTIIGRSRFVLVAGFGGLLVLLILLGVDAIDAITAMQARNASIQRDYLVKSAILNELRSHLHMSGTYVRAYLLEPDRERAHKSGADVTSVRREMEAALRKYAVQSRAEPLAVQLERSIADYWRALEPVLTWTADQRKEQGYRFLRDEVFPRRMRMLRLADEIAAINVKELAHGNERVVSLFQQFRKRHIALLLVCVAVGATLALFASRRLLKLERDAAARYAEVADARSDLQDLSARLIHAQENERRAISRELHDEIGQSVSALLVGLSNLSAILPNDVRGPADEHILRLRGLAETSLSAIRNMCLLLRPSMLDDLGLLPAVQWHAREMSRRSGILVSVAADEIKDDLPDEHKTCVYRVTQEALHNACRHSSARTVRVSVRQQLSTLCLTVQDDGCGFNPVTERGLGIVGMQERVARLGGTFVVKSQKDHGTLVAVTLPIVAEATGRRHN